LQLATTNPFGSGSYIVATLPCGERGCRATTPCTLHEQVIVRLRVNDRDYPEYKIAKRSFAEMEELHRERGELFHMLADFALMAVEAKPTPMGRAISNKEG
jgi:predicted metal-binding transcription factor (methanogenesis marker protein 9)